MPTAQPPGSKSKTKPSPYQQIKVYTTDGKASTITVDKNLYAVIEHEMGAKATIAVARKAAKDYDAAQTRKSRSAYVVEVLQDTFGIASAPREEGPYALLRVKRADGDITTVSLPQPFMSRLRRQLSEDEIQRTADAAAARYDSLACFTRSEHIRRALKGRIGEKVPSEIKLVCDKFKLSLAELASVLKVSERDLARWDERGEITSGPARMVLAALWKGRLKLSDVFKRKRLQERPPARSSSRPTGTRSGASQ